MKIRTHKRHASSISRNLGGVDGVRNKRCLDRIAPARRAGSRRESRQRLLWLPEPEQASRGSPPYRGVAVVQRAEPGRWSCNSIALPWTVVAGLGAWPDRLRPRCILYLYKFECGKNGG
ncbi:hypothetical protein BS78_02G289100 [Paspalum vaginatum]|nr:hypothetical protein BS78_02G289100 [Paspalum vaginatum]